MNSYSRVLIISSCLWIIGASGNEISWTKVNRNGSIESLKAEIQEDENVLLSRNTEDCGCGKSLYGLTSCGDVRRGLDMNRIIGGRYANTNEIPWQARLVICREGNSCFTCGGSLINHQYVLTAAHCLVEKGVYADLFRMKVELGVRDVRYTSTFTTREDVMSFSIHGEYDQKTAKNDIALVKLKRRINFNDGVKPICLPKNAEHLYVGNWAIASGWGQTSVGDPRGSNILKRTRLRVLKNDDQFCINGASLGRPPWIKQMCAYDQNTDTCGGDSGGPLTLPENGKCTLVGIVSYGLDCALAFHAGVYTRVTEYLFWIKHIARDGGCLDDGSVQPKPKYCDMRCLWGTVTATYYVTNQRHKVNCNSGICYAVDPEVDLCKIYNYPCGNIWS